ncbi:MAG: hypothetical protein QXV09_05005 [Candidatus Bathyarchaeia archaeon]
MPTLAKAQVKRKTFVAREDLIDRLSAVAKNKGYSLYSLINEIFEIFLKAEEAGLDLRNIIETSRTFENAKRAGFILGLESLWYAMADIVYKKALDEAKESWFQAGVWFAKRYLAVENADSGSLEDFLLYMKLFAWNISELRIDKVDEKVYLTLFGPRFSASFTELFKAFLYGLFDGYGYKVIREDVCRGVIRLEAVDKNGKETAR